METYWRLHPKGTILVGSKIRDETWDARKLRAGTFRAFKSILHLLKSGSMFDAATFNPDGWEVVEFGGGNERRDTDPSLIGGVIADAWEERARTPLRAWLVQVGKSADSKVVDAANLRLTEITIYDLNRKNEGTPST